MNNRESYRDYLKLLKYPPYAYAYLTGDRFHPQLYGTVRFFKTSNGILIATDVSGLPENEEECAPHFLAFHIHEGNRCAPEGNDEFGATLGHYNPQNCQHPHHAGDLPPLLVANGHAFSVTLTEALSAEEIIGRTIVIHSGADDFKTQPSGNAGTKIGCGLIRKY